MKTTSTQIEILDYKIQEYQDRIDELKDRNNELSDAVRNNIQRFGWITRGKLI